MKLESPEVRKLRLDERILSSDVVWGISIDRSEWDGMSEKEQRIWKDLHTGSWVPVNPRYVGWTRRKFSAGFDLDIRRFIERDSEMFRAHRVLFEDIAIAQDTGFTWNIS